MERKIIHLNIADFSVAVERLVDRSLQSRPLIIAPQAARARVFDMSEEAYRDGVRKGMSLTRARNRCRRAVILPPTIDRYEKAICCCFHHALPFTPQVERAPGSGHLYLDVTGTHRLFGPAPDIGRRIRKTMRRDLGFDPIWSVGPNKLVAKVASRVVKPAGEYIVAEGEEQIFLDPLPLSLLPTVDRSTKNRLHEVGIRHIAQAAALSRQDLYLLCGRRVEMLYQALRGIDQSPVHPPAEVEKRFFFRHHFSPDSNREEIIQAAVLDLARQAARSLRRHGMCCCRVEITLLYSDTVKVTRQAMCKHPATSDRELEQLAVTGLFRCWRRRVRLRTIALACTRVSPYAQQLSLFSSINKKQQKQKELDMAIDVLHERFGASALTRGITKE